MFGHRAFHVVPLCVLLMLMLATHTSVDGARSRSKTKHVRHHHHRSHLMDDLPPPPPRFKHKLFDDFRFASTRSRAQTTASNDPAASGGTSDIVSSVYTLLSSKRDENSAAMTKIMQDKLATAKKQDALRERAEELKERAAMLTRLQYCLEQDGSKKRATVEGGGPATTNSTVKGGPTLEQLQAREDQLNSLADALNKLKMALAEKEKELKERELKLEARLRALKLAEDALAQRQATGAGGRGGLNLTVEGEGFPGKSIVINGEGSCPPAPQPICPGDCEGHRSCGDCVSNPRCGWCRTSQKCMDMIGGVMPKGNCSRLDLSHLYCKAATCEQHRTCHQCMSDPECGRCGATNQCSKGTITGPDQGSCPSWNFAAPMRFFSLNIYGRDLGNLTDRASAIFAMIEEANADFIALQEVEDWFLELMASQKWARSYHASDFGSGHAPGGLLILSKIPLASVAYYEKTQPGQVEVDQRGRMLIVKPNIGNLNFHVATTTLDWRTSQSRIDALDYLFSVLNSTSDAVLMGDFNFDYGAQPESSHIPKRFKDVWMQLRPERPGFTWDPIHNAYAHASDPHARPSRIDRIFVASDYVSFNKITKVGSAEVSPHYGLLTDIQLFGAFC